MPYFYAIIVLMFFIWNILIKKLYNNSETYMKKINIDFENIYMIFREQVKWFFFKLWHVICQFYFLCL